MESKAKLLGHPIHPMLIVLPLGLFIAAFIFDVVYLLTDNPTWATVAFWNIAGGVIGGLLAAIFGLIDWLAIPDGTRAKSVGLMHGFTNVVVIVLFSISWLLRWPDPAYLPDTLTFILELIAIGVAGVSGWLGGELVDRLGVGVDSAAHLNAPSSLSDRPARESAAGYERASQETGGRVRTSQ
jgi:uncharacterized membrane protein